MWLSEVYVNVKSMLSAAKQAGATNTHVSCVRIGAEVPVT